MKNNNKGFSLVELIVVIAIMAILAAVAVVGVSVYIPKAQQASDKQLIADIEDILLYEGYAGTFEEGESGYIVISKDGVVDVKGAGLEKALINAYGADYKKTLKLAYEEWGSSGLMDGLSAAMALSIKNSSYMTGGRVDDLLSDVETMTFMASNLVTVLGNDSTELSLSKLFTTADGKCVLDTTAAKYGITKGTEESWEVWGAKDENKTAYSNLLVLAAADESEKRLNGMNTPDDTSDDYTMSAASDMILEFSSFYAYAAKDSAFSATLDKYLDHLNGKSQIEGLEFVDSPTDGAAWFNALKAEAGDGYTQYMSDYSDPSSQAKMDENAFLSIMAGLGNPTDSQADLIAADINNANLFTSGAVNGMYNDYMDAVEALSGAYDEDNLTNVVVEQGEVAIMYIQKEGTTVIISSIPKN